MTDIINTMDRINGLAALLYNETEEPRLFESDDINGVSEILRGFAEDLFLIEQEHVKALDTKSDRERCLERTLVDFTSYLLSDPDPVDLKQMAANIRQQLEQ